MQCDSLSQNLVSASRRWCDSSSPSTWPPGRHHHQRVPLRQWRRRWRRPGEPSRRHLRCGCSTGTAARSSNWRATAASISVDEQPAWRGKCIARVEVENVGQVQRIGVQDVQRTADPHSPRRAPRSTTARRLATTPVPPSRWVDRPSLASPAASAARSRESPVLPYTQLTYTVNNGTTTETVTAFPGNGAQGLFTFAGSGTARVGAPPALPANAHEAILYYFRPDGNYTGWGLHLFPLTPATEAWTLFPTPGRNTCRRASTRSTVRTSASACRRTSTRPITTIRTTSPISRRYSASSSTRAMRRIRVPTSRSASPTATSSSWCPASTTSARCRRARAACASRARRRWVNASTLLWTPPAGVTQVRLLASMDGSIKAGVQGLEGAFDSFTLTGTTRPTLDNQRQLSTFNAWALPAAAVAEAGELARQQLVAIGLDADGVPVAGTLVQTAGALDDLYADSAYGEPLGVTYAGSAPSLAVWAPTALLDPGVSVKVYEADGTLIEEEPMTLDEDTGIWSVAGTAAWNRKFYTINLRVYSYAVDGFVDNEVTDPYSVSLSTDSIRSQFVNLDDADLKPAGWDDAGQAGDRCPGRHRCLRAAHSRFQRCRQLGAGGGSRQVHGVSTTPARPVASTSRRWLLPADPRPPAAGVRHRDGRENRPTGRDRRSRRGPVRGESGGGQPVHDRRGQDHPPGDGDAVAADSDPSAADRRTGSADLDGFNWGYDPLHFGVRRRAATRPIRTAPARSSSSAAMVTGLRRHRSAHGDGRGVQPHQRLGPERATSVLDRLVPGYYHRRNETTGTVLKDSCCDDTASEFRMMEKLMVDTSVRWARRVQGGRFPFRPDGLPSQGFNGGATRDAVQDRRRLDVYSTARAGTSAHARTTGASCRRRRPTWAAPASAGSATASVTRCAVAALRLGCRSRADPGLYRGLYYDPNAVKPVTERGRLP